MPLSKISEFADFLAGRDRTLKEILNHLSRSVLEIFEVDSIAFCEVNESNQFFVTESAGISAEGAKELDTFYDMDEEWPAAETIRHGRIIWINSFSENRSDYPKLEGYPVLVGDKSLIIFPVFLLGTPVAALIITSRTQLEEKDSLNLFLTAVASVFSMYYLRDHNSLIEHVDPQGIRKNLPSSVGSEQRVLLTDRQLVILRLISEDRTNKSISEFLGYSESTVRQDIMKIFAHLGCTHRSEAAAMYKDYSSKHLV